jgi:Na+-driven multidrug efflux pump
VLVLIAAIQPVNSIVFVGDGAFQGAKDFRYLAASTALASALAAAYMVQGDGSLPSVWKALVILQAVRAATLLARYTRKVTVFGGAPL